MNLPRLLPSGLAALALVLLAACASISPYDQAAYEKAVDAKVDTLALMAKATESYASHQKDVDALNLELDKAYEYDKGRPNNALTVQQWDLLLDPHSGLVVDFFQEWQADGTLKPAYVADKRAQVGSAFDQIIGLEAGKTKPSPTQP